MPIFNFRSRKEIIPSPQFAPLVAAVIAPLSTLLDIPALTENWFFRNDTPLRDPVANLTLSAVGLLFNVLANLLLILRFSVNDTWWRIATNLSLVCWVLKFGLALGNIVAYASISGSTPNVSYGEGFWCAVLSLILVAFILVLLFLHYFTSFWRRDGPSTDYQLQVRLAGRQFMIQNTLFVASAGLLALVMSRIEHWTYLQGIYFSICCFLTVGFGDFKPTKVSTRILLFPFVLAGIIQLASLVDMIAHFFTSRAATRYSKRRADFERRRQKEEDHLSQEPDLERELQFLRKLYEEQNKWKTVQDLTFNIAGFMLFWLIGALIFSQIENWTYGDGLYFNYIFFLTLGFGDFVPTKPAGRVVFIVYSLVAVPVMTSFAVQTIQGLFKSFATRSMRRREENAGLAVGSYGIPSRENKTRSRKNGFGNTHSSSRSGNSEGEHIEGDDEENLPDDVKKRLQRNSMEKWKMSHGQYVALGHKRVEERLMSLMASSSSNGQADNSAGKSVEGLNGQAKLENGNEDRQPGGGNEDSLDDVASEENVEGQKKDEDRILTEYILELAVELEQHARRLLLGHMQEGSNGRMLLKADRIVQLRNIRLLASKEKDQAIEESDAEGEGKEEERQDSAKNSKARPMNALIKKYYEEESELLPFPTEMDDEETLEEIAKYRESFANILAVGSRLLGLKDEEQFLFERRLKRSPSL